MSQVISIGETAIHAQNGLFSLNDLHQASGGEDRHKPKYWSANQQTQDLIAEISKGGIPPLVKKHGGRNGSQTYAVRELVIAYAAWISPAFHLKVIRVFLDATAPASLTLTPEQAGEIYQAVARLCPDGAARHAAWRRFNIHFNIASYRDLPAARFEEAMTFIGATKKKALPPPLPALPRPEEPHPYMLEVIKWLNDPGALLSVTDFALLSSAVAERLAKRATYYQGMTHALLRQLPPMPGAIVH